MVRIAIFRRKFDHDLSVFVLAIGPARLARHLVELPAQVGEERPHHAKHGDLALGDAMREGAPFMVAAVAMTAGAELDKTVVLRAIGNVAAPTPIGSNR